MAESTGRKRLVRTLQLVSTLRSGREMRSALTDSRGMDEEYWYRIFLRYLDTQQDTEYVLGIPCRLEHGRVWL